MFIYGKVKFYFLVQRCFIGASELNDIAAACLLHNNVYWRKLLNGV